MDTKKIKARVFVYMGIFICVAVFIELSILGFVNKRQIIDEDKKREEELSIKAKRDELTGLLNR